VEHRHRLVPRQLLTVLAELLFPIRSFLISTVINEGLELPIRHLILIDPEITQGKCGDGFVTRYHQFSRILWRQ
jgi:hypothetical protein